MLSSRWVCLQRPAEGSSIDLENGVLENRLTGLVKGCWTLERLQVSGKFSKATEG